MVRGGTQYYGTFYRSALYPLLSCINAYLMRWIRKKYKRLQPRKKAHECWQGIIARYPRQFRALALGLLATARLVNRTTRAREPRGSRRDPWEPGGAIPRATRHRLGAPIQHKIVT
jgi:hypothetical protein